MPAFHHFMQPACLKEFALRKLQAAKSTFLLFLSDDDDDDDDSGGGDAK